MTRAMPDEAVTPEYLLDNHWIVGDPDEVARKIRALYEAVGGFGSLLAIAHDWPDPSVWDRSMTLLATEVMPRVEPADRRAVGRGVGRRHCRRAEAWPPPVTPSVTIGTIRSPEPSPKGLTLTHKSVLGQLTNVPSP